MGREGATQRRWPGRDGWALIAVAALIGAVYLGRGQLGGGGRLLALLGFDAAWLAWTWWSRRRAGIA